MKPFLKNMDFVIMDFKNVVTDFSISKTMDMGPVSIKKHEWFFANVVPISTTKHEMTLWGILKL